MKLITWNLLLWISFFDVLSPETLAYFPCITLLGCLQKSMRTVARYRIYRAGNGVFINVVKFCLEPMSLTESSPNVLAIKLHENNFFSLPSFCSTARMFRFLFFNQHQLKKDPGLKWPAQEVAFSAERQIDEARRRS